MNDGTNVTQAMSNMHEQRRLNIAKAFGKSVGEIKKANDNELDENPFEKAANDEENDIKKSDIMDSISYDGNIKFTKTGKEIKKQIQDIIMPAKKSALEDKKKDADELLSDCGDAPTKDVDPWWTNDIKIDVPYKVYSWNELDLNNQDNDSPVVNSLGGASQNTIKNNTPETVEESNARKDYNQDVRCICGIMVDIKACELLLKNLADNSKIDLTPRQVITFMFD